MKFCLQLNPQVSLEQPGRLLLPALADQIHAYKIGWGVFRTLPRFDWTPGLPQNEILASMRLFGEKVIQKL